MAVLKAPLFSFAASGKLADTLVFMKWKGLNDVRKYVIPTNPKSAAQITQRFTNFKAGVTKWHTFALSPLDLAAWALLASTCISKRHLSYVGVMSNFNAFMRYFVDGIIANAAAVWNEIAKVTPVPTSATLITVTSLKGKLADNLVLYYGKTTSYMPTPVGPEVGAADDNHVFLMTPLVASTKYYFYIKATAVNKDARTGIYSQKTLAA